MKVLGKRTIKRRIVLCFVLLVIVPFLLSVYIFYGVFTNYASKTSIAYMTRILKLSQNHMDNLSEGYQKVMAMPYYNRCVELLSQGDLAEGELTAAERQSVVRYLKSMSNSVRGVDAIYLESHGERFHVGEGFQKMDALLEKYRETVREAKGRAIWLPARKMTPYAGKSELKFLMGRSLYNEERQEIGVLWMMIQADDLQDAFQESSYLAGSTAYLMHGSGEISLCSDQKQIGTHFDMGLLKKGVLKGNSIQIVDGARYLFVYSSSYSTKWTSLIVTPMSKLIQDFAPVKAAFWGMSAIYLLFAILMMRILEQYIFRPVRQLIRGMDDFAAGDFAVQVPYRSEDEIGKLTGHFNRMILRVTDLLHTIKQEEKEKNDFKMQALAMQMSPHFIYNSLNTIKWMAVINKQDNIRGLVDSLIKILMNMSRKKEEENTIGDELELIENYAVIQKMRFLNFDLEYEVEEGVKALKIKRFWLQPIVENAILHGFGRGKRSGKIVIRIWKEEAVHVVVQDNGVGFDVNAWKQGTNKQDRSHTNIGLNHVNQMITLEYGSEYGVVVESIPDSGTVVSYRLPIVE